MKTHSLKVLQEYYMPLAAGNKPFEIRFNDRDFQRGDKLILKEFDGTNYTGRETHASISYIFSGGKLGLEAGYIILGLKIIDVIKIN